ncbi:GRIP and coiled-coil domain-containing protein 1-like [Gigantopelta aegis]|uniref:GRIP and coiled-coil domain-containing protein 1-like n=1 Tax=Gigantopelta aegis TaxID=1735272 RepID=UPI001B8897E4|nr:GRIP and coiled-coil domain-containing protein 1-like [Gigantopelta aegis]XP_041352318.1 GRIP and coiled-coil domain-containing protein 1-like [Gigantopelta aegis]
MDRATRNELLKTIESQKEQIQRYEGRLRDVVRAYKGLVKEKEALEASIKVLSSKGNACKPDEKKVDSAEGSEESQKEEFADPLNANSTVENENEVETLRNQLQTLSESLSILTQEKSRLEANFVADHKKLRQENEELQKAIADQKERAEKHVQELNCQIQELKNKIRCQQLEREKEQTDHVVMLRELQKLVAMERSAKEQLEQQLDEAQATLKEKDSVPDISEEYQRKIRNLSNELTVLRDKMKAADQKSNQPSPLLLELQNEMAQIKAQHRTQVQHEQKRAREAEDKLQSCSQSAEDRISSLESKLSELSDVVGNYERLRFQDQQAIHQLRERVTQLDMENTALARAANSPTHSKVEYSNLDAQGLADQILQLKAFLRKANQRSEKPISIEDILRDEDDDKADEENPLCKKYKQELEHVREEFERYKLRAQSVLKNKNNKDSTSSREVDFLKDQIADLRERLKLTCLNHEEEMEQSKLKVEQLTKTIISLQEKHKQELASLDAGHQKNINELQLEVRKQRERTVSMLAEKDQEIQSLRPSCGQKLNPDYLDGYTSSFHDRENPEYVNQHSQEEEAVSKLLDMPSSIQGESTILYFAQEQARKNVEINGLRKQKRQMESDLRELQHTSSMKEERLTDDCERLREEVRKLERDKSREGANLEYLKNVVFQFLMSTDVQGKQQMLNAITTILQFSPKEKEKVCVGRGWMR